MGQKNSKVLQDKLLHNESTDGISCSITLNGGQPVTLSVDSVKTQFGNKYLYFYLPRDFLKDEFQTLNILYQNVNSIPNYKDSCLLVKNSCQHQKIIIDGKEYWEYSSITDVGGKFNFRVNISNIAKSLLVYSNNVDKI